MSGHLSWTRRCEQLINSDVTVNEGWRGCESRPVIIYLSADALLADTCSSTPREPNTTSLFFKITHDVVATVISDSEP